VNDPFRSARLLESRPRVQGEHMSAGREFEGVDERWVAQARALGPLIREHAAAGEAERRLSSPVVEALLRSRLTVLFLPRSLGGAETDPVTCMRVVEELAMHDAAAAWLIMVANAHAWASSRLPAHVVEEMFSNLDDCVHATTFQPPIEAREAPGGFRLRGRRAFASGCHAARYIGLTAIVMDGAGPKMVGGMPQIVAVSIPASKVQIIDTWRGLGMRGTDSNDVAVDDVFVPSDWTFGLSPDYEPNRHHASPLYRFPMVAAIAGVHITPVALALGRRALDAVYALCEKRVPMASAVPLRERGAAQEKIGRAEATWRAARALVYQSTAEAWRRTQAGERLSLEDKSGLLLASTHAVQSCVEVVDAMFSLGGSSAVYEGQPLERVFRDVNVLRQHGFVSAGRYETCAQVALGLPPDLPLLHF
jgi:alkylation response protein AidB-like acyl-CoA dehydrogenase